jgi:hypothetical protein
MRCLQLVILRDVHIPEENALIGISRTEFKTLHSIIGGLNLRPEAQRTQSKELKKEFMI